MIEAEFWPVYWQPWSDSLERLITHVVIRPLPGSHELSPQGAYITLSMDRLKSIVGVRNARSAFGILNEVAIALSGDLSSTGRVSDKSLPFYGFGLGDLRNTRGFSAAQMLDSAIRSVSVLSQRDGRTFNADDTDKRSSMPTSRFLTRLRTDFAGNDLERRERFGKKIYAADAALEINVDYSYFRWMVQVSTLPTTEHQIPVLQREAQSKLLELEALRKIMDGNPIRPLLMVNEPTLTIHDEELRDLASSMKSRLSALTTTFDSQLVSVGSAREAVQCLERLS